jgi:hypothetical protein
MFGPGKARCGFLQAAFGLPNDVGLQLIAMLQQHFFAVHHEMLAAQH